MRVLQRSAVALSCVGLLTAQFAEAAGGATGRSQSAAAPLIQDVALQAGGSLRGQISDVQGTPQVAVPVSLLKDGVRMAAVRTDRAGQFAINGLSAGIYQVQAADSTSICRVWAPGTAPPGARHGVLVVEGQQVVRGGGVAGHPWLLAAIVFAAIAIPVALDSNDSEPLPPAS